MKRRRLKPSLGLLDVAALGIGAIIGGGVFVAIGIATGMAGPAILLSMLVGGVVASLTALSVVQLSSRMVKTGGYGFAHEVISPFAGFIAGWMWMIANLVVGAAIAIGLANYVCVFFPFLSVGGVAAGAIILFTLLNYLGIRRSAFVNTGLVFVEIAVILFFVAVGIGSINMGNFVPFAPHGAYGVLQGAAFLFFAYGRFVRITTISEEVKRPKKTIPKAVALALGISVIAYLIVGYVVVGLVGHEALAGSGSPLADALKGTGGLFSVALVSIGAIAATSSVLLTTILGLSRMGFAMGRDRELPYFMSELHPRYKVPDTAIVTVGGIMMLFAVMADLTQIIAISSFVSLLYYALINLSALFLSRKRKSKKHMIAPTLGIFSCIGLLFFLTIESWIIGVAALLFGVLYYCARKKLGKK